MDVFRESPFTPTQLKSTYPGCVTFPNAEAFHTHIWDVMGLSAAGMPSAGPHPVGRRPLPP